MSTPAGGRFGCGDGGPGTSRAGPHEHWRPGSRSGAPPGRFGWHSLIGGSNDHVNPPASKKVRFSPNDTKWTVLISVSGSNHKKAIRVPYLIRHDLIS